MYNLYHQQFIYGNYDWFDSLKKSTIEYLITLATFYKDTKFFNFLDDCLYYNY
jgi:hypothetical protein